MKTSLLAVSMCVVSGCSWIEIEHTQGELPDLNLPSIEKVCDHKARIEEEQRGLVVVCEIKI